MQLIKSFSLHKKKMFNRMKEITNILTKFLLNIHEISMYFFDKLLYIDLTKNTRAKTTREKRKRHV